MKIVLDLRRTLKEIAALYYEKAKTARAKRARLEKEIEKTKELIAKEQQKPVTRKKRVRVKREKRWYERFRFFFTTNGYLVLGGRDAKQNDILYSRYLEPNDLFYHADVHGASVVVLKNGLSAPELDRTEAAQFAAVYSSGWKMGYSSVDVYSVRKDQVSKYEQGAYVGKGGFMIHGERVWYRSMPLVLTVYLDETTGSVRVFPGRKKGVLGVVVTPGDMKKGDAARAIVNHLNKHIDEHQIDESDVLSVLPSGGFSVLEYTVKQ
ncbi:DUF814 domain-containing protein [Candidatus Micrarchaeota archaeon]|nr:DUF814 domain-containing protein [Candidatus Micrarchaeota archaeon]